MLLHKRKTRAESGARGNQPSPAACAQAVYLDDNADPSRLAVEKLPDGSWTTRLPVTFGRSVRVGAGAILHRGTVINGVDFGAVLDRRCGGGGEIAPAVRF